MRFFHVSSAMNRASIEEFGLDWTRMAAAPGIAGSPVAEVEGCFLVEEEGVDWFVSMNNTGGPVDVWQVDGIDADALVVSPEGYNFFPDRIAANQLTLVRRDVPPDPRWSHLP